MLFFKVTVVIGFCVCAAQAVLNGNDLKRREAFDSYGPPPRPAPQYGPPPPRAPHREYGVPQQIPFREYGAPAPALKYGPPKLNFLNSGNSNSFGGGLHEQIKSHFGVPKPFYGPPHVPQRPGPQYGPPPPQPAPQYGPPPKPNYGPPPKHVYGPPPAKHQHRPAPQYGPPPKQGYGPPPPLPPPHALPPPHPAPLFKPAHQPATSYGPPASGPLNFPPRPVFDAPPPNYGPPPLPVNLPGPQPGNFNGHKETTIIVSGAGGAQHGHSGHGGHGGPIKQVQIQIDSSGHTHSVSGSQAPFHTACDGWKPIPAPVGSYVEHNNIDTQSGYSQVAQGGGAFGTQYNAGSVLGTGSGGNFGGSAGGSIIDGLTDEQLVAVALQSGEGDNGNVQITHSSGSAGDAHLNSIETDALQLSLGSIADSYSKPPFDSYAPGSLHAQKYNNFGSGPGPIHGPPSGNYGPPPPPPVGNYIPPPPPPFAAALVQEQHHHQSSSSSSAQSNLGLQYGVPSGNAHPFPQHGVPQPSAPVAYRPPVPQGLLESIGATVQHLDQFGVKPQQQPPTYIPPAANEIAQSGPELSPPAPNYGPPNNAPVTIIEQQLPQPQPAPIFIQQQQHGNAQNQFVQPPPPPQQQYLPPPPQHHGGPIAHVRPLGPPTQQYLPPPPPPPIFLQQQQQRHAESAYSASQYNQQILHSQALPLQQEARFGQQQQQQQQQLQLQLQQQQPTGIQVHDCGHGPNLIGGTGYQVQQTLSSASAASSAAYNAIAPSIPVAEQHTQFISGPSDSYGPPPSGNELDHIGYASQKSSVTALPDGTDPQDLPGLDGLNVISAQKSQSIQLNPDQNQNGQPQPTFQVQFGISPNSGHNANVNSNGEPTANHEEILSQGLLQSILTAIEQPQQQQQQHQQQHQQQSIDENDLLPFNHKAQSRSDDELHEQDGNAENDANEADDDNEHEEQEIESSHKIEVKVLPETEATGDDQEEEADVKEIKPIITEDIEEQR